MTRATIDVDGIPISYLTAGEGGPLVLLLHGTYWSRVWQPVLDAHHSRFRGGHAAHESGI
jgi:pimeloyl-ACP methyl ester carboxylesterase